MKALSAMPKQRVPLADGTGVATPEVPSNDLIPGQGHAAEAALKSAARIVEAEYYVPHLPHVPMEPPVAVARVEGDTAEVWLSTQNPQAVQDEVARALGIKPDNVRSHVTFIGGRFGRKSKAAFASEAALLAREMSVPVRMQFHPRGRPPARLCEHGQR